MGSGVALMSKRITTLDDTASVSLPPEAVDALGVSKGDELDIEIVGRALVVRAAEEARRSRSFAEVFDSVLKERRPAYEKLAERSR
jgi:antitoxin component of MazEF toxin-antitoxin module